MGKLTGGELLKKIEELKHVEDLGKSDLARACGYFETREDGSQRIDIIEFYEAIMDARDFSVEPDPNGESQVDLLPSEWKNLTEDERIQKIISEKVETKVLRIFSGIDEYKYAVALSENTSADILDELKKEEDYFVGQALIMRCLPQKIRRLSESDICSSIKKGSIQDKALAKICTMNSWTMREAVANAPNASQTTLRLILEDKDPLIQAIAANKLINDDLKRLSSEDLAIRIVSGGMDNQSLEIVTKSGDWKVRFAAYMTSKEEPEAFSLDSKKAFAFRCFDSLNRNADLILGDDQKLIILRSGGAGDEDYAITLEKVLLDEDGDPEDYEQIGYYDNSLESVESAIQDYINNEGLIGDLESSLST